MGKFQKFCIEKNLWILGFILENPSQIKAFCKEGENPGYVLDKSKKTN